MKGVVIITYRRKENRKEQKEYKFLNKMYRLSQQGKLTWKRIKWGKFQKIALIIFFISIIVSSSLFIYMFFVSWSERAFAKKNLDFESQTNVETFIESTDTAFEMQELTSTNSFSREDSDTTVIDTATVHTTGSDTEAINATNDEKLKVKELEKNQIVDESKSATPDSTQNNTHTSSSEIKQEKHTEIKTNNPNISNEKNVVQDSDKVHAKLSSITELAFVSVGGTSLFDFLETKREIGKVKYGTYVKVIDQKESSGTNYSYVVYYDKNNMETMNQGWVRTSNLTFVSKFITSNPSNISLVPYKKVSAKIQNVRGIYISRATASTRKNLESYAQFVKRNNLNALVIDVKDDDGTMLFKSNASSKHSPNANKNAVYTKEEIKEIINNLKAQGIYLIARIVCFKDPTYARSHMEKAIVFKDTGEPYMGVYKVPWASAYDRELWQYNIKVAKEAIEVGFDEIQYDYVRFPELSKAVKDRVNLRQIGNETMAEAIHKFLLQSKKELEPYGVPLTADIFGLVSSVVDDLGIGQHWESISNVVDYVCPMVYPSHYANGSFKLPTPDAYPYETVYNSVLDGIVRNKYLPSPARIRPWIQAFTATWVKGHIRYGEEEIRKQIKALKDLGINEYMLWNASNRYIEMKYE